MTEGFSTQPPVPGSAPHRPLTGYYASPEARAGFVSDLFNKTAPHYDWLSAMLGFGGDRYYRRLVLKKAGLKPGAKILDVATGTGLVAQAGIEIGLSPADIAGLDPSAGMLQENMKQRPIRLLRGVGERLPFKSGSFDFVTMGYALRHVESLQKLFEEFYRVLKPGGRVLVLEISRPECAVLQSLMKAYFYHLLPLLARWRSGGKDLSTLSQYYWTTIAECVPPAQIIDNLRRAGFAAERKVLFKVLSDYIGAKPA